MERPLEALDPTVGRNLRDGGRSRARVVHLVTGAEATLLPAVPRWRTAALEWLLPSRTDVVLGCAYALAALDRHLVSAGSTMTRSLAGGAPT